MAQQVSIRSAVFESLHYILSSTKAEREAGEEKLKALEVTEDFGLVLTEICVDVGESAGIKQLAAVLLRQYVESHWSQLADKFSLPEVSPHMRMAIRSLIPQGLSETNSKVRSIVAYVISSIAHWDWPDDWPELMEILMQGLASADGNIVHGSMRVLTEFIRDITDKQMKDVAPALLPELYRIFITTGQYSNRSRARAVVIFNTCVSVIIQVSEVEKGYAKQILVPVLPKFIEAFLEALQSRDGQVTDLRINTDIMKCLILLVKCLPNHISPHFKDIVSCVWQILVNSSHVYLRSTVYDSDDYDDKPLDSDGEVLGPESLIYSVFEFIDVLVETPKFHSVIKSNIKQLLYYITIYSQLTTGQEKCWLQSPDQYVEDEDDSSFSFSIRIAAHDLLQVIVAAFDDVGLIALAENILLHVAEASESRRKGNEHWWKIHEAVFFSLGAVPAMFHGIVKEGKVEFDIAEFFRTVVLPDVESKSSPFLTGRCVWLASRFSQYLDGALLRSFLEATVAGLSPTHPAPLQISCVRASFFFCENLANVELLLPVLPLLYEGCMSIAQSQGSEVLALSLDSMEGMLKVNKEFTASVAEKSMPLFMAVFLKFTHDQHIIEICRELIMHLAVARNDIVQEKMLPTLVSIIQQQHPDTLPSTLQPGCLEMVETLVRGSNTPISGELMALFPMVANLTILTDDSSIMQNGGECLRAYISTSAEQIVDWRDEHAAAGHTGLSVIGAVVSKLLDPRAPENSAAFVGKLVSVLISKLGESMGSDLDLILRAVLSKLQRTETHTIVQELVLVFARLVITKVEALLDFLTITPGPDGSAALNFVLTQWCSHQHLFYGRYEVKLSSMALCKLLQYAISSNDSRLQEVYLKEEVVSQSTGIRTRSRANAGSKQWTNTPILIKMFKLLINELANQIEEAELTSHGDGNTLSNGEVDEYKDISDDETDDHVLLSSLIEDANLIDDECEEETDPDILCDPIYHLDLKDYLTEFLNSLSSSVYYETFRLSLTLSETRLLQSVGISNC